MKNFLKKYIGTKIFYKQVFIIILPIMLQQLLMNLAGYVDNVMINSYGGNANAYNGVNAANRFIFVCNFIFIGLAACASIFIAQYFGAKNKDKINESVRLGLIVSLIFGFLCFGAITLFGNNVVNLFVQSEDIRAYGYEYLRYIRYGVILSAIIVTFGTAFRSVGRPKVALINAIIGIVVNVFFNWCMIFGHLGFSPMGAKGAAIATDLSRVAELVGYVILILFEKKSWFYGCFKKIRISLPLVREYIKRAIPLVFNELLFSIGAVLLARYCTYKNDTWYNAYAYAQNISELFFIVFAGLGNGTGIIIGSALGNDELDKALEYSFYFKGLAVMMGLIVGVLMIILAPLIAKLFNPSDEVYPLLMSILRITAICMAIYCYNSVCFFILRAGGDAVKAFILDQIPTYIISVPIAVIFGINASKLGIGLVAVYALTHIADFLKIFMANFFVSKKTWLVNITRRVEDKLEANES